MKKEISTNMMITSMVVQEEMNIGMITVLTITTTIHTVSIVTKVPVEASVQNQVRRELKKVWPNFCQ